MTFYLKITIIARLLLFFVYINYINAQRHDMVSKLTLARPEQERNRKLAKTTTLSFFKRSYLSRTDLADLTKGLSDAEIEAALSDLTLTDLDVLSKLIDTSNNVEYDYDDDGGQVYEAKNKKEYSFVDSFAHSFSNTNSNNNNKHQGQFYGLIDDPSTGEVGDSDGNESIEEEDDAYEDEPIEDTGHLVSYQIPRSAMSAIRGKNLRLKRENSKDNGPQIIVDEEYLKQLENSFPHDQEQNDQDDVEDKKDHVRVKRT